MHRGHAIVDSGGTDGEGDVLTGVPLPFTLICSGRVDSVVDCIDPEFAGVPDRLEAAAIAAFRTVANGGLIPQARHGGSGAEELAVAGSKLEGTGFENEQIGHIHVAFDDRTGVGALEG